MTADIPRMQSKYAARCRCGCNKVIRRGDTIGLSTTRWGEGWLRMQCAVELHNINICSDIYMRTRWINARRGIEPDISKPKDNKSEPFVSNWLDEDLLCEDVVCPGLG